MKRIFAIIAAFATAGAPAAYKCVDTRGLTLIGETPPEGCANVVMYEVTNTGKVLRRIDPTPTPEQLKKIEADRERQKEQDRIAAERKRKDLALVNTYSSEHEIEVARDRNIEPIQARIKSAEERIEVDKKRQAQIEEQLEFYRAGKKRAKTGSKADEVPPNLIADLERVKKEQVSLAGSIESARKEIEATRVRFEADRQRWLEVKGLAAPKDGASATPTAAPATKAPAKPLKNGY